MKRNIGLEGQLQNGIVNYQQNLKSYHLRKSFTFSELAYLTDCPLYGCFTYKNKLYLENNWLAVQE